MKTIIRNDLSLMKLMVLLSRMLVGCFRSLTYLYFVERGFNFINEIKLAYAISSIHNHFKRESERESQRERERRKREIERQCEREMYIYIHTYIYIYVYIERKSYIERCGWRERER